mgnify:CR=1 FL=1
MNIYQLMAKSTYCIGVFSAALIESIYFNSKLLLLDLPGVEIEKGTCRHIENKSWV